MTTEAILHEITEQITHQEIDSQKSLNFLKRDIARKHKLKHIPTNMEILLSLPQEKIEQYKRILLTKPTRTISGVSPVAVMTRPSKCPHGKCTFCVGGINSPWGNVPQSYTGHEPATMRGIRNKYDSYLQVFNRLQQYVLLGQSLDKNEVIIMGGTFTAEEKAYQEEFVYGIYKALNDFSTLFFSEGKFDFLKFKAYFLLPGDIYDKQREEEIHKKLVKLKNDNNSRK
jgi:elongator complex protein 3